MKDEGTTAEMIRKKGYWGWERFLAYFERLQRPGNAAPSTRTRWRREIARLDEQLDEIGERRRMLAQKLSGSCSHPVDSQVVHSWLGEDTLGNMRSESSTEYTISCGECKERLAAFTKYDEDVAKRSGKPFPWEK
jgi:hypothetical protein